MRFQTIAALLYAASQVGAGAAAAQSTGAAPARPWGRVSFFTNVSRLDTDSGANNGVGELTTAVSYQLPEDDDSGVEYGVDLRHSKYARANRADRTSLYEGFVGARLARGAVRIRAGQLWMNDLGSLGSVAGGAVEWRQPRLRASDGRVRVGVFGGLEPNIFDVGYAPNVRKSGAYLSYEGEAARRHTMGYVRVKNASLLERSVVTTTNFLPVGRTLFVYQAMEYDLQPPAQQATSGLAYFFTTARVRTSDRLEVQGTYSRGHSVDVRGLSENILNGRPITQAAAEGLLYESAGARVTIEPVRRLRVYGGYSSDKNNRDAARTGRILVGGYASNVADTGVDVTASDTVVNRPTGRYHSRYVSIGRQLGRHVYVSGDYTTSLSVVRFSRSDGVVVESRPHTARLSGTASVNLPGSVSLLMTAERTRDDDARELRLLAGLTYRIR
jgi:hypothetical protein